MFDIYKSVVGAEVAEFNVRLVLDCVLLAEGISTQTSNDNQLKGFFQVSKSSYSKEFVLGTSSF